MSKPWEPADYQLRAVEHLVERSFAGLFLKPGMRKTSIVLAAFQALREAGLSKNLLVLAPLRVCYTSWPSELRKWEDFSGLSAGILHGPKKDKVLKEKHDIYLMNYEGLPWLIRSLAGLAKWPFDMLAVDESTRMKTIRTQRFKLLKPHLKRFRRRVIMTGSPMANNLIDVFGQAYVMDQGATFGGFITRFREELFYPAGFGGYTWLPKKGTEETIHARLAPRVFYADDEDYLKLPPLMEKIVEVELPKKAMDQYRQLETALRLDFENGSVNAANTAVATIKLRQLISGGVYLDGGNSKWEHIHEAKTEAVLDLVEELSGAPALVAYEFLHDLERLKRALKKLLGVTIPHLGQGGTSGAALPALIRDWTKGNVPVIIVQPQSAALGIDGLQEAGRALIWHSNTYNAELYDQLIRRLRRSGQQERVLNAKIVALGTMDAAIIKACESKEKTQGAFFKALKEYWQA